jgi:hydroxyacylglutathione hydrolase
MQVLAVPCLRDNYAYLVIDRTAAAVVDPGEAGPVVEAIARAGVRLAAVWLTHHHWDHVGGVQALAAAHPGLKVIAHDSDLGRVAGATRGVRDGEVITLGDVRATIVHNPGHTLGAISYWIDAGDGAVFTGDTLFGAGCGRLFEGTASQMYASLTRLAALPPSTRVYFGHEYTASNLAFATHVEPDNQAITARAAALRTPSTPSTIGDERATNPFVRARDAEDFAARRAAKDSFR